MIDATCLVCVSIKNVECVTSEHDAVPDGLASAVLSTCRDTAGSASARLYVVGHLLIYQVKIIIDLEGNPREIGSRLDKYFRNTLA